MSTEARNKSIESLTYEEAVEKVENLLSRLEQSDVPLEQAIKHFEEGTKLIRHCENILADTEHKVSGLVSEKNVETSSLSSAESLLDDDIPF